MSALLDFIHASNVCVSKEDLTNLFKQCIGEYGYTRFTMGFLQDNHCALTEREKSFGLMVNYPDEWLMRYMQEHYVQDDPIYRKCATPCEPFTWKEALLEKPDPRAIKLMSEAKEFGLIDGIGLSFYHKYNKVIGFGLSCSDTGARKDVNALSELNLAAIHCFEIYAELDCFYKKPQMEKPLSHREREVLLWTAKGLTKKRNSGQDGYRPFMRQALLREQFQEASNHKYNLGCIKIVSEWDSSILFDNTVLIEAFLMVVQIYFNDPSIPSKYSAATLRSGFRRRLTIRGI